ncbi:MAG: ZrgA family zinc uptake protein [Bdellovibrio bacteriovorus]
MPSRPAPFLTGALLSLLSAAGVSAAPGQDTATIRMTADGSRVEVDLRGPAAGLVGFEQAPRNADQRQTLALAAQNLKTGDGLVRFSSQAGCRLEEAQVDADPAPKGKEPAELGAHYRFHCDRPEALGSAALGLFMGFPALARAHVHYDMGGVSGEAVLTPANPVVTFVPLR